jgi:hypothetical protein
MAETSFEFKDREDGMAFLKQKQAEIDAQKAEEARLEQEKQLTTDPKIAESTIKVDKNKNVDNEQIETKENENAAPKKTWQELLQEEVELSKKQEEEKEFKDFMNDELVKTLYNIKKSGKDPKEFVKTLHSVDPTSFTEKQLFEASISEEKNENGQPLTEQEVEEKWEQFQSMPKSIQQKVIDTQRNEYQKKYDDTAKSFKKADENPYLESAKKATEELVTFVGKLVGTKVFGVDITDNIAKDLYKEASEQLKTTFNGSVYDSKGALEKAISIKMLPSLVNEVKKAADTDAKLELFKHFNTPSSSGKPVQTTEIVQKSKEELQKEALDAHAQRAADPFGIKNKTN